jgi:hypothetical protein
MRAHLSRHRQAEYAPLAGYPRGAARWPCHAFCRRKPGHTGRGRNPGRELRRAGQGRRTGANDARNKEIRDWAREKGLDVNERGRIPADIVAQFEVANGK